MKFAIYLTGDSAESDRYLQLLLGQPSCFLELSLLKPEQSDLQDQGSWGFKVRGSSDLIFCTVHLPWDIFTIKRASWLQTALQWARLPDPARVPGVVLLPALVSSVLSFLATAACPVPLSLRRLLPRPVWCPAWALAWMLSFNLLWLCSPAQGPGQPALPLNPSPAPGT